MQLHVKRINSLRTPKGTLQLELKSERTMNSQKKPFTQVMEESRQEETTGKKQTRARLCEERKDFRFLPIDLYKSQTMGGCWGGQEVC